MALDTRNKRASALGIALASLLVLPAPDATIAGEDRQHVAYAYAGISAEDVVSWNDFDINTPTLTCETADRTLTCETASRTLTD